MWKTWRFLLKQFYHFPLFHPKWANILHQLKAHSKKCLVKLFQIISAVSLENPEFKGCSWQSIAKFNANPSFNPKVGEGGKHRAHTNHKLSKTQMQRPQVEALAVKQTTFDFNTGWKAKIRIWQLTDVSDVVIAKSILEL